MEIAELVLRYVDVLAWPVLLGVVVVCFRAEIADKIDSLKEAKTPIAEASFFDQTAQRVAEEASEAVEASEASIATSGSNGGATNEDEQLDSSALHLSLPTDAQWLTVAVGTVLEGVDLSAAREIAQVDPNAAVMTAYREVEKVARAAVIISRMEPLDRHMSLPRLLEQQLQGSARELVPVARELATLRNSVTHAASDVSSIGALSFIDACEELAATVARTAVSRLRHPSRRSQIASLLESESGSNSSIGAPSD